MVLKVSMEIKGENNHPHLHPHLGLPSILKSATLSTVVIANTETIILKSEVPRKIAIISATRIKMPHIIIQIAKNTTVRASISFAQSAALLRNWKYVLALVCVLLS